MRSAERSEATLLRVPLSLREAGVVALPESAALYAIRVHRLRAGDRFLAFDPELAVEAEAEIVEAGRGVATARIGLLRAAAVRPLRRVTWIQCACKGDKMDQVVRDATELGVTRIVPAIAERSVARPDAARAERWRRIAIEAARQCGRGDAPTIAGPMELSEAFAEAREGARYCLDPRASAALGSLLREVAARDDVTFAVGPEGGFSGDDLAMATQAGFLRARVGRWVLRTETVCAAVVGALVVLYDDDGASRLSVE